jgi:hypothetical protein
MLITLCPLQHLGYYVDTESLPTPRGSTTGNNYRRDQPLATIYPQVIQLPDLHPGHQVSGIKTWITQPLAGKRCDAWVREDASGTIVTRAMKHSLPTIVMQ